MEIITSFTALNLEPGNLPKEASQLRQGDFQSVLKALQDAYCNTASDPDAYLYETVAPENIIFGLYEPEKVLERFGCMEPRNQSRIFAGDQKHVSRYRSGTSSARR